MNPRALIPLLAIQREQLADLFALEAQCPGSALMAQVFPDGIHVQLVDSDMVIGIQKVTGVTGYVNSAEKSYQDAVVRELEAEFLEEDHEQ